jgi:hypothetical protein
MVGRMAEPFESSSANSDRKTRAARRVGTKMVTSASVSGLDGSNEYPSTMSPERIPAASVRRKAGPGGIVRTRFCRGAIGQRPGVENVATAASAGASASGVPTVIQWPASSIP